MKKSLAAFLLCSFSITSFASGAWDGTSVSSNFSDGNGTEENPWQINSPEQLAFLAQQVNSGTSYTGEYFILTGDIDLNGKEWTPIGTSDDISFRGVFDGNSHLISNLYVNLPGTSGVGLFGHIYNATVKNLGITGNSSVTGKERAGGLVGRCYVNAEGHTISGCFSEASVSTSGDNAGGLIGMFRSVRAFSVENCYSTGDIVSSNYTGGIVGRLDNNTDFSVRNCYSAGNISSVASSPRTGGILTKVSSVTAIVTNCYYITGDESNANSAVKKTAEEMKSGSFVEVLNNRQETSPWKADFENPMLNKGLPVPSWRQPLKIELNLKEIVIATLINKSKSVDLICTLGFPYTLDHIYCELEASSPFVIQEKTDLGDNRIKITIVLNSPVTGEFSDILKIRFQSQGADLMIPVCGSVFENAAILLSTDKLEFDTSEGEPSFLQFTLSGAYLENDVILSIEGDASCFMLDRSRISADEVNEGTPVTVTFNGKANAEATVKITSQYNGQNEVTATLQLTGKIAPAPVFTEVAVTAGGYDFAAVRVASDSITTVYYVLKTEPDDSMTADLIRKSPDKKCKYLEFPLIAEGILLENLDSSVKYYLYLALAKGDKMECLSFIPGPELSVRSAQDEECRIWASDGRIYILSGYSSTPVHISVYNVQGLLLKAETSTQREAVVEMDRKGIYIIVVETGGCRYVKKIILD